MIRYSQSHKVGITAMTLLLGFPCYSKVYLFLSLCLLSRIIPMGFTVQLFQRGDLRGFFLILRPVSLPWLFQVFSLWFNVFNMQTFAYIYMCSSFHILQKVWKFFHKQSCFGFLFSFDRTVGFFFPLAGLIFFFPIINGQPNNELQCSYTSLCRVHKF